MQNWKRYWTNNIMMGLTCLASLIALVPLFFILFYVISHGIKAVNWDFFTQIPKPVGEEGGGMANALVGSLEIILLASLLGLPIGILGGIYLSENGEGRLALVARFTADMLNGIPSIVIGIFVYTLVVLPMKSYSALAGGIALGIMMIPTVMRTTEEILKLVPCSIKEGGLALGIPYWRVLISLVLSTARSGIITGVLLAISRIAGETAPLLFTTLGNQYWSHKLNEPMAALPLQIFVYAISPYESWQQLAWAGALVLMTVLLLVNVMSRFFLREKYGK